jgi:hypothetical protein
MDNKNPVKSWITKKKNEAKPKFHRSPKLVNTG